MMRSELVRALRANAQYPDQGSDQPKETTFSPPKRNDQFYTAWNHFLAAETESAKVFSRSAHDVKVEREELEQSPKDGARQDENAFKSWQEAAYECKARVSGIVKECTRLNQKYHDVVFDLEENALSCLASLTGRLDAIDDDPPLLVRRVGDIFEDPKFFIDGASAIDVHQGKANDCWFLAALMSIAAKKELVERVCVTRNEKVGVYGFVFYRDGEWIYEVIDDKLFLKVGDDDDLQIVRDWDPLNGKGAWVQYDDEKLKAMLQQGDIALYFGNCKSDETWLPLLEKAYAKAHGDYESIEYGYISEGIEDLTGGVAVALDPEDIMDKNLFWKEQLCQVNKKYLFGGGSKPVWSKNIAASHAYAILDTYEEGDLRLIKIKNPWGKTEWNGDWGDGSKMWTAEMITKLNHTFGDDGIFWMRFEDFQKQFPAIFRTRLFDETWRVSQQWLSVQIPWTADYLDTKFQFTISEKGPVVLVMARPDERYFKGLQGRFDYNMHFQVYKEGDKSHWIVRSMHTSGGCPGNARSISAEIEDLDPGTYNVVFKIIARRWAEITTAEEMISKSAINNKQKLLEVGRRFDYAHTKGKLEQMEAAVRMRKKQTQREKLKVNDKKIRRLGRLELQRARLRKKRVKDATKKKREEEERVKNDRAEAEEGSKTMQQTLPAEAEVESSTEQQASSAEAKDGKAATEESSSQAADQLVQAAEQKSSSSSDESKPSDSQTDVQSLAGAMAVVQAIQSLLAPMGEGIEGLQSQLAQLTLQQNGQFPNTNGNFKPPDDETNDYDPLDDFDDDDFEWDSDMDGPVDTDADDDNAFENLSESNIKIFGDDPWNAVCVLSLRVCSQDENLKVQVVKGKNDL